MKKFEQAGGAKYSWKGKNRIFLKIIEPEAGPPFTSYNSSSHNAYV